MHERLDEVEMIRTAWELRRWEIEPDEPGLQKSFVRLPLPWIPLPSSAAAYAENRSHGRHANHNPQVHRL